MWTSFIEEILKFPRVFCNHFLGLCLFFGSVHVCWCEKGGNNGVFYGCCYSRRLLWLLVAKNRGKVLNSNVRTMVFLHLLSIEFFFFLSIFRGLAKSSANGSIFIVWRKRARQLCKKVTTLFTSLPCQFVVPESLSSTRKVTITFTLKVMSTPELKKKKIARDAELAKKAKESAAAAEKVK